MVMMSKLMDVTLVKKLSIKGFVWLLERTLAKSDGTLPPFKEQVKGLLFSRN